MFSNDQTRYLIIIWTVDGIMVIPVFQNVPINFLMTDADRPQVLSRPLTASASASVSDMLFLFCFLAPTNSFVCHTDGLLRIAINTTSATGAVTEVLETNLDASTSKFQRAEELITD